MYGGVRVVALPGDTDKYYTMNFFCILSSLATLVQPKKDLPKPK